MASARIGLGLVLAGWLAISPAAVPDHDDRWFLGVKAGAMFSDSSDLDTGPTVYLSAGKPLNAFFDVQFDLGYGQLSLGSPRVTDYDRVTAGVTGIWNLRRGPDLASTGGLRPYLLAGANLHRIDFQHDDHDGYGLQVGAGLRHPLSRRVELLLEGRYGIDFVSDVDSGGGVVRDERFYTWTAGAGLRVRLGDYPPDSDGDGVPDPIDECPGTPRGMAVDRRGCPLDSDGDGVPDHLDRCPNTPPGVAVDANGCGLDSDGDGVPDHADHCPNTPRGTRVDERGCPWRDSDGDGVPDALDRCPDTPRGVPVDPLGCPLDSDGDGVPDYRDECPNTPAGAAVLPSGCALVGDRRMARRGEQADGAGFVTGDRAGQLILDGVTFEFDSARLTPEAQRLLDRVAETLQAYPDVRVDIEGHTDNLGTATYNLGLSERRAQSVRSYLVSRGVEARRMRPVGYGLSRPIDSNDTESGRAANRRVEFRVHHR